MKLWIRNISSSQYHAPKFPPERDASVYACHLKTAQPKLPLAQMAGGDFNLDPFNYATWDLCVLGWSEGAVCV